MSGDMASLHSGLIQRTRKPSEEKEWQQTPEKKAEQDSIKQYIQGTREDVPASLSWLSKPETALAEAIPVAKDPPGEPQPAPIPVAAPTTHQVSGTVGTPPAAPRPAPPSPPPVTAAPTPPTPAAAPTLPTPAAATIAHVVETPRPAETPEPVLAAPAPQPIAPVNRPRPFGRSRVDTRRSTKQKSERRKALTLRLDIDEYERMIRAREATNRTSQDILETALSVYLNLLSIDDD